MKTKRKNVILCVWLVLISFVFTFLFFRPYADNQAQADPSAPTTFVWQTISSGGNYYISYNQKDTLISAVGQVCVGETQGGVYNMGTGWGCEGSPTKVQEEEENTPYGFTLSQNYPNPFNPVCNIEYAIPKYCKVELSIYNILGQKIRVLVDEYQSPGYKCVRWNSKDEQGQDVASGVYLYRIQAGVFGETKKMLLLK